jgi:hypothetical protein
MLEKKEGGSNKEWMRIMNRGNRGGEGGGRGNIGGGWRVMGIDRCGGG